MKTTLRQRWYIAIIALSVSLASPAAAQNLLNDSIKKQLQISVAGFKERYHSPAIVVLVVHDKDVVFYDALGYTDLQHKVTASIDSKFPILSMTKPFTATMLMQLVQKNMVRLDDDIRKYVPEFQANLSQREKTKTTLLQLATHTAGLPRNSPADINFTKSIDRWILAGAKESVIEASSNQEFLTSILYTTLEYPKYQFLHYGDRHYSNMGYTILGIGLQRAAKTDYTSYIIRNIFQPLKMDHSGFITSAIDSNALVKGYFYDEATHSYLKTPFFKPNSSIYAGGMYTTANDLAKFLSFQFDQESSSDQKILSDENKAMMIAFNIAWKPAFPFTTHEGAMLGYKCQIAFNPDLKLGWIILTNTTEFEFSRMNDNLSKLLLPAYSKQALGDLKQFIGVFKLKARPEEINIYLKNDSLYSSYLNDSIPLKALMPTGPNSFRSVGNSGYFINYEFVPDSKGEVTALNMGQLMWIKKSRKQ